MGDIHEQELLVLLLVLDTEFDQVHNIVVGVPCEEIGHGVIYVTSVGGDLFDAGTSDDASIRARVLRSNTVVVRVEQCAERRMELPVTR
jgi:hypothetical protein